MAHYLDDFIQILRNSDRVLRQLEQDNEAYSLITDCLGIPRNESKYQAGTSIPVFGLIIDTDNFIVKVPQEKLDRIQTQTAIILSHHSVSRREIESITGLLSFCAPAVSLGWVFMRLLWNFVVQFRSASPHQHRRIPNAVVENLIWWNFLLPIYNGVFFFDYRSRPPIQLYTDASMTGLGGFYYAGSDTWTRSEILQNHAFISCFSDTNVDILSSNTGVSATHNHINTYEVQAILLAFQTWAPYWYGSKVTIHTDSTTAFEGLRKHTLKGLSNQFLREIFLLAAQKDIQIVPRWIQSEANSLADALSHFKYQTITNMCPHWQYPLNMSTLQPLSLKPFRIDQKTLLNSFGMNSHRKPDEDTTPQSNYSTFSVKHDQSFHGPQAFEQSKNGPQSKFTAPPLST